MLKTGAFDEYESLTLCKFQEIHDTNIVSLQESHDWLQQDIVTLQNFVAMLYNAELKNYFKTYDSMHEDEASLFHTIVL